MSGFDYKDMTPDELEAYINDGTIPERLIETNAKNSKHVVASFGLEERNSSTVETAVSSASSCDGEGVVSAHTNSSGPSVIHTDGFDIKDPVELLFLLDDDIRHGRVHLHDWQIQHMLDFARGGQTDNNPFQALVRACNGSGKDKYIISPCSVWVCMAFFRSRAVVTSSSGKQLDSQTCTYIDMLCNEANRKIAPNIWKINYRYYECLATQSPIECFATDEPGKAEGYHPLEYGRKMALFMSEAKTVPDTVNMAFNKCTGYTHRVHVSTPGLPLGHFYEYCQRSPYRKDIKDMHTVNPIDYIQYHVTAFDCTHLSKVYIEQMKRDLPGGEHGAAYKSQVLAEFATTDEMVVIPYTYIWQAMFNAPKCGHLSDEWNTAGVDLSAGGDETAFAVRNGNKLLAIRGFRYDNTQATISYLDKLFKQFNLNHPKARIYGDAGGLGKPILDSMREMGWKNIRYVTNQGEPLDKRVYKNRGAEMWFEFGKLLEGREVWLAGDDKLRNQLSTRYYKITPDNRHQLESKIAARAKGHPSPDRADATVLCFSNYKSRLDKQELDEPFKDTAELEQSEAPTKAFSLREWAKSDEKSSQLNPSRKLDFAMLREEVKHINQMRRKDR